MFIGLQERRPQDGTIRTVTVQAEGFLPIGLRDTVEQPVFPFKIEKLR